MAIYTIGFTKKTAERFFNLLGENQIQCLVDIRVHPGGQLSGYAKGDDLAYFLRQILQCRYIHLPELAPTEEILSEYRSHKKWDRYVEQFEALMDQRNVPDCLDQTLFSESRCCLLCSEATPDQCHRRLVAERLAKHWTGKEIVHLV
jgi:uncharacterized protein (DUF488 family)